jgi:uncharacterized membrane protein
MNTGLLQTLKDRQGTVAICSAALLPLVVGCAALAIDTAAIYLERRTAQGVVDLAAINAAAYPDQAESAARATLAANSLSDFKQLAVIKGRYEPDATKPVSQRFQENVEPFNAVRVELVKTSSLYFASLFDVSAPEMSVSATASMSNTATYSVGSNLAVLQSGVVNSLLSALVGGNIQLSLMEYNALVDAKVRIDSILNMVAAEMHLTGVTYSQLLDTQVSINTLAKALATVARQSGADLAATALDTLASQTMASGTKLALKDILDLGSLETLKAGETYSSLSATVGILEMLRAAALLANGSHQLTLALALNIPGVTRTDLTLYVGEPMQQSAWAAAGEEGSLVRTAQLKLRLVSQIGGKGLLAGTTLTLPIYAEAAYADARLADVTCSDSGNSGKVTIAVQPGAARAAIADVSDAMLASPELWQSLPAAKIVKTSVASVTGLAVAEVGNASETSLTFDEADIAAGTIKQADTHDYLSSLATSLIGSLQLNVQALGLGLSVPSGLTGAVSTQLAAVGTPLDQALYAILTTLGVSLGQADVRVNGTRCGSSVLID